MLRIAWFGEKVDQKNFQKIPPTDMCAEKFQLMLMGGWAEGLASQTPVQVCQTKIDPKNYIRGQQMVQMKFMTPI